MQVIVNDKQFECELKQSGETLVVASFTVDGWVGVDACLKCFLPIHPTCKLPTSCYTPHCSLLTVL